MGEYEEVVELGIEGIDKLTDKYHDRVYDRIPAWKRRQRQQEQQNQQDQQSQRQRSPQHPDKGYPRPRSGPSEDTSRYEEDPEMYASDRRQEHDARGGNDERYYEDERPYYQGPYAGAVMPRGFEEAPYQQPSQRDYDQPRDKGDRGRPSHQRRGSSWSPPRSEKHGRDSHKPRASSRAKDNKHRVFATVGGAIVGGFAANKAGKGKPYDAVATFVGAIVGGVGAREAVELWDDRRRKREETEEDWEEENGVEGGKGNGKSDDRHGRKDRRRYS